MSSSAPGTRFGMLSGKLSRRLFGLFFLASLVPLSISAWVSTSAISQVADDLNLSERQEAVRRVSKLVLDRLQSAASVIDTIDHSLGEPELRTGDRAPAQLESILSRSARLHTDGNSGGAAGELNSLWFAAKPASPPRGNARPAFLELRSSLDSAGITHVLVGTIRSGAVVWLAEINPEYLWQPLNNASEDSSWVVKDGDGRILKTRNGGDADPLSANTEQTVSQLFLLDQFGAKDWTFQQRSPRVTALWHGKSLTVWLALVAISTLLGAAALIHWQIRRTLAPLQTLREGTRSLAAGQASARVVVERDDEIGELATSFNQMASSLQTQFAAMRAVAEIDRGVIDGASMRSLAELASRRLGVAYPLGHTVRWRDEYGVVAQTTSGSTPDPQHANVVLPIEIESVELGALGVIVPIAHAEDSLRAAKELRDRLTVAFAARARERQLVYRASHDSLTGLLNRYGLNLTLDELLVGSNEEQSISLLLLDLDHFKEINDSMGHAAGDELLCLVAHRLRAALPAEVSIARQGGDEFAIAIVDSDPAAVRRLTSNVVAVLSETFPLRSVECSLGASVGVAHRSSTCNTRDELLRQADLAMYAAKAGGRGRYVEYTPALNASADNRLRLVTELRDAVARDEWVVHYQPRVNAVSGRVVSAEALVRWQHPTRGLVYPDAFIQVSEQAGLIVRIGTAVLDKACSQMVAWRASGLELERVSVNISPLQLVAGDLPATVREILGRHELAGTSLELEVTESVLVGDVTSAHRQLAELRAMGIKIALDDFGTGYSSLSSLRVLPIDVIKIDRSFVRDLHVDSGAMAVTQAIVALAKSLRKSLVAEGVETPQQAAVLCGLGCDELQGYHYARALTPENFVTHLVRSDSQVSSAL